MKPTGTSALQELLDRRAIDDLLARYCRTLDWLDADGLAGVFWPDADLDEFAKLVVDVLTLRS